MNTTNTTNKYHKLYCKTKLINSSNVGHSRFTPYHFKNLYESLEGTMLGEWSGYSKIKKMLTSGDWREQLMGGMHLWTEGLAYLEKPRKNERKALILSIIAICIGGLGWFKYKYRKNDYAQTANALGFI